MEVTQQLLTFAYKETKGNPWIEGTISTAIELPAPVDIVEDILVNRPLDYQRWLDPDIQSGSIQVDEGWPDPAARVRYRYPPKMFMPFFGSWHQGVIQLTRWDKGSRVTLVDRSTPGNVETTREMTFKPVGANTTMLETREAFISRSRYVRVVLGGPIRSAIPVEGAYTVCKLAGLVAQTSE